MRKLNVLLVDDAPFIRDVLRTILTKEGHLIVGEAENGEEAVQSARDKRPDLIIMDIVMPIKSGIQATKEILETLPETKIIACSTIDQDTMLMKVLEAGAVDFIHKPFQPSDVVKRIERVFGSQGGT